MQKAKKIICPADIGCEAHARVSSDLHQTCESASGYQNAEFKRLAFLWLHLPDAVFSNVRSVSLLRDMRLASLRQNAGLIKSIFFKCR